MLIPSVLLEIVHNRSRGLSRIHVDSRIALRPGRGTRADGAAYYGAVTERASRRRLSNVGLPPPESMLAPKYT